jgi:protease-4
MVVWHDLAKVFYLLPSVILISLLLQCSAATAVVIYFRMKQFLKFFLASVLGVIIGQVLLIFILAGMLAVIVSTLGTEKIRPLTRTHILEIKLEEPLQERTTKNPFKNLRQFSFKPVTQPGVYDLVQAIDKAAKDEHIKGIYLHTAELRGGLASVEEIRNALLRFKSSGKFIISYADAYNQSAYYLATVADTVFLHPTGMIDLRGYVIELLFMRGMFDKLEIEPQIIRHGKFKNAGETFSEYKMSPENRQQMKALLDSFWAYARENIAVARKLTVEKVQQLADNAHGLNAKTALQEGLADRVVYEDEILQMLRRETHAKEKEKPALISIARYYKVPSREPKKYIKDRIAVIFANGVIELGKGEEDRIGSETLAEAIRKAREDDKVKAIVFRVNSPGGDALASDIIWREIKLAADKKPLVVSMSDLAASGGYYISCAADSIFVHPNTLTGSIGVIGLYFNLENFLKNKLGITTDGYKTAYLADLGIPTRPLTDTARHVLLRLIDNIYDVFTSRVSEGRKMEKGLVDSLGQGRIWAGVEAIKSGLADRQGGLSDAIECARRMAGIEEYKIIQMPELKEPFQELLEGLRSEAAQLLLGFGKQEREFIGQLQYLSRYHGVRAILPFEIIIH